MPKLVKRSKSQPQKNEALSTMCCFFSGLRATFHELKIERLTIFSQVFWDTCKFSVIDNECLATVFRDHSHRGNRVGRGNVTSPERAGLGRLHTQILGGTVSGNVCRRYLFSALPTPTCVPVPQEQFQIVACFEMHVAVAHLLMLHW